MHKLIKKGQSGIQIQGGLTSFTPTIPDLKSSIPGIDFSSIKLQSVPVSNPYSQSTILGKTFNWNSNKGSKLSQAFSKQNIGSTMGVAGQAADMLGSLIPQKEQSALTTGLNTGYDAAANAAMAIPGVGTIIGGAMKVGGMLSDGLTALGVGTDQMTTADKILDSKFLKLTPMGLINAFGAKKADTITKDNEAFEQVGSSYGGVESTVNAATEKSGKKYGLLSGKARKKANREIAEAKRQQSLMAGIADEAKDSFAIQSSMSDINNRRYALQLQGGYNQNSVRVGKAGLKVITDEQKSKAKKTLKNGKRPTFDDWFKTVPEDRNDTTYYNLRRAYELAPFEELEKWRTATPDQLRQEEYHLKTFYMDPKTGIGEFMKRKDHPTIYGELDFYNSNYPEAIDWRNRYNLDTSGDFYKYIPKSQKFAEGGKMNVIPDGALHARLHHMNIGGITKKGIPVITQEEGGDITQHAEIERDEIIFTKEVTQELERLYKKGTDEAAILAGKLLAREIIENTQDNTGLMQTVE